MEHGKHIRVLNSSALVILVCLPRKPLSSFFSLLISCLPTLHVPLRVQAVPVFQTQQNSCSGPLQHGGSPTATNILRQGSHFPVLPTGN